MESDEEAMTMVDIRLKTISAAVPPPILLSAAECCLAAYVFRSFASVRRLVNPPERKNLGQNEGVGTNGAIVCPRHLELLLDVSARRIEGPHFQLSRAPS